MSFALAPTTALLTALLAFGPPPAASRSAVGQTGTAQRAPLLTPSSTEALSSCPSCAVPTPIINAPVIVIGNNFPLCVTTNLTVATPFGIAVEMVGEDMVLDLGGKTIDGGGVVDIGILAMGERVVIRNGRLVNFARDAIRLGPGGHVENVTIENVGESGIVAGPGSVIRYCRVTGAGMDGISVGSLSKLEECVVEQAMGVAIKGAIDVRAIGCTVSDSMQGISLGTRALVRDCVARSCTSSGIEVGQQSRIQSSSVAFQASIQGIIAGRGTSLQDCNVADVLGFGIVAGDFSRLADCTVTQAGACGISAGKGVRLDDCTTAGISGAGITTGPGSVATSCIAMENVGNGMEAGDASLVSLSQLSENQADGLVLGNDSFATRSVGANNTGNGISVLADANRIEANHLSGNAAAIQVAGADNLVIENSANGSGFFPYVVPANNTIGPIGTMQDWIHSMSSWINFHLDF